MGRKKTSETKKIVRLLEAGHDAKFIADKLGIERRRVYTVKYLENKKKGLGSLLGWHPLPKARGKTAPKPKDGIGTPPRKKRKYVRKNTGTGITTPKLKIPMAITMIEPPSLWQRVVGWFRA